MCYKRIGRNDWVPGFFRYREAVMASLDAKTTFGVAEPSVVLRILTLAATHGHVVAALLAEMKLAWRTARRRFATQK